MKVTTLKKLTEIITLSEKFDFKFKMQRFDSQFINQYLSGKSPEFVLTIDIPQTKERKHPIFLSSEDKSIDVAVNKLHKNLNSTLKKLEFGF